MFVLLILAIRFLSRQSKQDSKINIIDDEAMNLNNKIEKNSNSFTNLSNYQKPALLADNDFDGLEKITSRSNWIVTANSWQASNGKDEGPPDFIKDDSRETRWHSRYNYNQGGLGKTEPPFYFIIDLKETVRLGGIQYAPRLNGVNGRFTNYNLYTGSSVDEVKNKIPNKKVTAKGNFHYTDDNDNGYKSVRLQQEVECSVVAFETDGSQQESNGATIYAAVCSDFNVYVNRNIESPTKSETESPIESETESQTENKTESESETETGSQNEKETETQAEKESLTIIENETENDTKTKSEVDTDIEFSSSETEETNINSEKVTQTKNGKEEQKSTQSTDEKDDDQSQPDTQYHTSLETKIVTSIITDEIIPPDEETNGPSNGIIMSTNELTSNTPQNTTNVIDNTKSEIERESSLHSEDSINSKNTALITGVTVGVIVLIIIVVLLIIFLIYRHKRLEYNSTENDFPVEMDDGALNILDTNIDAQDDDIHSDQSDIAENPFMKDDFIESNNKSDINDNYDSNNVDDFQDSESSSE